MHDASYNLYLLYMAQLSSCCLMPLHCDCFLQNLFKVKALDGLLVTRYVACKLVDTYVIKACDLRAAVNMHCMLTAQSI